MSARTQAKVLRVLQSGEVEPVGAQRTVTVDVRVIAATNRDLEKAIEDGDFREDLFYRLNVVPIRTPPLREHLEDIPELVDYFVRRYALSNNYRAKRFRADALDQLKAMPWKGNVRELKNVVERLLILAPEDEVRQRDVVVSLGDGRPGLGGALAAARTLREFRVGAEKMFLVRKLREHDWNVTATAKSIETPRSNLYKKMEQYGIERESVVDSGGGAGGGG